MVALGMVLRESDVFIHVESGDVFERQLSGLVEFLYLPIEGASRG